MGTGAQPSISGRSAVHLLGRSHLRGARLVALGFLLETRQRFLQRAHVGQDELGLDGFHVALRVHLAGHVHDVGVAEEAHDLADGVGLADVCEELVAQAFALRCAGHETGDVHELDGGRHDAGRMVDLGEPVEARIGHRHDAHVWFDGGERVVGREAALVREGREQRGFADVRQTDDTDG